MPPSTPTWCIAGILAKSSADGHDDALEGRTAPAEPDYQIPVRRIWPFGIRSRPPAGVEAVVVYPNGSPVSGVMVGAESAKYGPSDLEEGETAVYSSSGATMKLDKDGNIIILALGSATIQLAGSTFAAPKWDDGTPGPTGTGFVTALNTFITALVAATTIANVVSAATNFQTAMAGAGNFSSGFVKNG